MTTILNLLKAVDHVFNLVFSPLFGPRCGHESHHPVHKGSARHPLSGVGPASRQCSLYLGITIEPPAASYYIDPDGAPSSDTTEVPRSGSSQCLPDMGTRWKALVSSLLAQGRDLPLPIIHCTLATWPSQTQLHILKPNILSNESRRQCSALRTKTLCNASFHLLNIFICRSQCCSKARGPNMKT